MAPPPLSPAAPTAPSSRFLSLPQTILEDIAFYLADLSPLGPPTALINLLLTHSAFASLRHSPHLYARIYRLKFDASALHRRSSRAEKDSLAVVWALAARLKAYCQALTLIKRGDVLPRPSDARSSEMTPEQAIHIAFVMLVENDGRNAAHLVHYAGIRAFAERYVRERVWAPDNLDDGWPKEGTVAHGVPVGEALWVWWLTTDPGASNYSLLCHSLP